MTQRAFDLLSSRRNNRPLISEQAFGEALDPLRLRLADRALRGQDTGRT